MMRELPLTEARWAAISDRDSSSDGKFVYAVRTTSVYCRPSCGARTPNIENVTIYLDSQAAKRAGYRACRRCNPEAERQPIDDAVSRARDHIDARLGADSSVKVTLAQLAAHVGVSRAHLQRQFKARVGLSPRAYADSLRVAAAKTALRNGETVLRATFEGGFGSGKALYERANGELGMTPGRWRRGGVGESVNYAVFETALGAVLVAQTDRGVCAVQLGDRADALELKLREELWAANIARDDLAVGPWAEPILRALAGAPSDTTGSLRSLPVDVRGTAFQRRVWAALREIPPGETRTYGEVAASIGRPTASRAVAGACASNRLAVVVPCHRVIGADGELRGYRWGVERKRRLLAAESAIR